MKVLNLYACLGGNRLKWTDCEVTAVELDPELARMYQEFGLLHLVQLIQELGGITQNLKQNTPT